MSHADYEACVALQRATWGDDFRELVPPAMLQVSAKMGGIVAGAFAGDAPDRVRLRDHRRAERRDWPIGRTCWRWPTRGATGVIGQRLKDYQRAALLAVGIDRMIWTFDPLVARNAHLNLERLGARVLEYVRDMYGDNPMSRTDSVIGSDRFVVEWTLTGGGTAERRNGGTTVSHASAPTITVSADPLPEEPVVRVAVPGDIQALKQRDPDQALAWRASTRRAFEHYLPRGYAVAGFERGAPGSHAAYRVERLP